LFWTSITNVELTAKIRLVCRSPIQCSTLSDAHLAAHKDEGGFEVSVALLPIAASKLFGFLAIDGEEVGAAVDGQWSEEFLLGRTDAGFGQGPSQNCESKSVPSRTDKNERWSFLSRVYFGCNLRFARGPSSSRVDVSHRLSYVNRGALIRSHQMDTILWKIYFAPGSHPVLGGQASSFKGCDGIWWWRGCLFGRPRNKRSGMRPGSVLGWNPASNSEGGRESSQDRIRGGRYLWIESVPILPGRSGNHFPPSVETCIKLSLEFINEPTNFSPNPPAKPPGRTPHAFSDIPSNVDVISVDVVMSGKDYRRPNARPWPSMTAKDEILVQNTVNTTVFSIT
jgi:hypothetical protein